MLYIGTPATLYMLVIRHKEGTLESCTAPYGCKRLLYFEGYEDIRTAIAWEKQLKGWRRGPVSLASEVEKLRTA
jgi:putative endonuclease